MPSSRADLNPDEQNSFYLGLTVVLVFLSLVGFVGLLWLRSHPRPYVQIAPTPTPNLSLPSPSPQAPEDEISSLTLTPTPTSRQFSTTTGHFSLTYPSSRTVYQDPEGSGHRYTFYSPRGNFAVHVGPEWSWIHPSRKFTTTKTVASHPTFVYDIPTQTIIDLESNDLRYTLQCLHGGQVDFQAECQGMVDSFQLLP